MDPWLMAAAWLATTSLLAFGATITDKARAGQGRRRIRERTLLLWGLVGGSPGVALGMLVARHKTRKTGFLLRLLLIVLLQVLLAGLAVAYAARR